MHGRRVVSEMKVEFDLDLLAEEVAQRVLARIGPLLECRETTPWMRTDEAIAYTQIPEGTFRKWVADGRLPSHGGRRRLFHRAELDAALGHAPLHSHASPVTAIRREINDAA
jgi:excisionase family DNA binding protein